MPEKKLIEDHEGALLFGNVYLVFPKHPHVCDHVRIVDRHSLAEIVCWSVDEWEEAGAEVMGAILGALCQATKEEGFSKKYTKFMQSQDNPAGE